MRIGWLASEIGIPISLGNTFLEFGVHMACALPEVEWLEYSFQNLDHLVTRPFTIRDGWIYASDTPGHGLELSASARSEWHRPRLLAAGELGAPPANPRLSRPTAVAA
jgi:L-alanine-DL-glutamate epimerase-like enolase superfamily enzyme